MKTSDGIEYIEKEWILSCLDELVKKNYPDESVASKQARFVIKQVKDLIK